MKLKNNQTVKIVYFEDVSALKQSVIFEGTVDSIRQVNPSWDGYEIKELFQLENIEVQVYKKVVNLSNKNSNYDYYYFVGPWWLNASQINHEKLIV